MQCSVLLLLLLHVQGRHTWRPPLSRSHSQLCSAPPKHIALAEPHL